MKLDNCTFNIQPTERKLNVFREEISKDYTKRSPSKRKQKKKQSMKLKSGKKILLTKPLKKKF